MGKNLKDEKNKIIKISESLYKSLAKVAKNLKFRSVEDFIIFNLEKIADQNSIKIGKKEEAQIKKRLKELGYLD